ncbi:MAG: ATP-binding protein [Frankiaceae bacterium]
MPTVEVSFAALPAHVRTARLIAVAVARRANVADDVLDELRLAVGEACSRAVALHERHAPSELVRMALSDDEGAFSVEVVDAGPSEQAAPPMDALLLAADPAGGGAELAGDPARDVLPPGYGLAVIEGLVEDVEVTPAAPEGTRVRMSWRAGAEAGDSLLADRRLTGS